MWRLATMPICASPCKPHQVYRPQGVSIAQTHLANAFRSLSYIDAMHVDILACAMPRDDRTYYAAIAGAMMISTPPPRPCMPPDLSQVAFETASG